MDRYGGAPVNIWSIQRHSHGLPKDLTDQIVQIYYTHPGVDTTGVLNRLEIAGK